jgi:hypothetical protein
MTLTQTPDARTPSGNLHAPTTRDDHTAQSATGRQSAAFTTCVGGTIGATNYPENVDPALRRAGRLDQVVRLSLPNVVSLEQIFSYYLEPYRVGNEVARGVKLRPLAELSFGLTGADVEFFVRVPRDAREGRTGRSSRRISPPRSRVAPVAQTVRRASALTR